MKPLYYFDADYAREHGERAMYRASNVENTACAESIDRAIAHNHDGIRLVAKRSIAEVLEAGFDIERILFVLAVTVYCKSCDERFSRENRRWADGVISRDWRGLCPVSAAKAPFCYWMAHTHPAVLDGFVNHCRQFASQRGIDA